MHAYPHIETSQATHQIALQIAAAAGALEEREERNVSYARLRIGEAPTDHMMVGLLDKLLEDLGALPGGDPAALRDAVRDARVKCGALRGADYLDHCVTVFAAAAAAVLSIVRGLPGEDIARRRDLLAAASHLAWCGHKDDEHHEGIAACR